MCFSKQWQDTLLISLHNFLATIFQCMPQPTLTRADTEASLVRKLQDENTALRTRLQALSAVTAAIPTSMPVSTASTSGTSTHQSRLTSFHSQATVPTVGGTGAAVDGHLGVCAGAQPARPTSRAASQQPTTLADIVPFDIPPPTHIVDDFYIIAMETLSHGQLADGQTRGLRSLIRNIGSGAGSSPVMGRKESLDRNKRRSGSTGSGRSWTLH